MPLPTLTPEQRADALAKAAAARRARVELKERLKHDAGALGEVLAQAKTNETVGKMKVAALLEALPGVGKVRARQIMDQAGIAETRRLQGLGARQVAALLELFPAGA